MSKAGKKTTGPYKVGYGKPPHAHRFKPGQSGNPSGRPKKDPSAQDDLLKEMQRIITVAVRGKPVKVTKQRAILRRLTDLALQGRIDAARLVLNQLAGVVNDIGELPEAPLTDQEIQVLQALAPKKGAVG